MASWMTWAKPGPLVWRCIRKDSSLGQGAVCLLFQTGTYRTRRLARGSRVKRLVIFAATLAMSESGSAGVAVAQKAGLDGIACEEGM